MHWLVYGLAKAPLWAWLAATIGYGWIAGAIVGGMVWLVLSGLVLLWGVWPDRSTPSSNNSKGLPDAPLYRHVVDFFTSRSPRFGLVLWLTGFASLALGVLSADALPVATLSSQAVLLLPAAPHLQWAMPLIGAALALGIGLVGSPWRWRASWHRQRIEMPPSLPLSDDHMEWIESGIRNRRSVAQNS